MSAQKLKDEEIELLIRLVKLVGTHGKDQHIKTGLLHELLSKTGGGNTND